VATRAYTVTSEFLRAWLVSAWRHAARRCPLAHAPLRGLCTPEQQTRPLAHAPLRASGWMRVTSRHDTHAAHARVPTRWRRDACGRCRLSTAVHVSGDRAPAPLRTGRSAGPPPRLLWPGTGVRLLRLLRPRLLPRLLRLLQRLLPRLLRSGTGGRRPRGAAPARVGVCVRLRVGVGMGGC
jgi:hypothetical protein